MKFRKLIIVYFCILSLFISINTYAAKCDGVLCSKKGYALKVPPNTKVNWEFHHPGSHSHHTCPKEEEHWHYEVLNQNPVTCDCYANGTGRTYVCGADIPAEHNDIAWINEKG